MEGRDPTEGVYWTPLGWEGGGEGRGGGRERRGRREGEEGREGGMEGWREGGREGKCKMSQNTQKGWLAKLPSVQTTLTLSCEGLSIS